MTINPIRVAINGYGNLGRGVEKAVLAAPDMELVAIFTRRDPQQLDTVSGKAVSIKDMPDYKDKVDVCVNCGGSATDLMEQGPAVTAYFNTVDSFDTHAKIPEHYADMDKVAHDNGHVAVISSGWDPGLFSINRVIAESVLPNGSTYTFWGRGVSQGHSDAIRRIPGVKDAKQYTVPVQTAVDRIKAGERPTLSAREKHLRECYVVAEEGADKAAIEKAIVTMENYFADYDTTVTFISEEELIRDHSTMPHGGQVIRSGETSEDITQVYSFTLSLDSNPEFTGSMLTATARATARLAAAGERGCRTVLDIAPALYAPISAGELRANFL